MMIDFLCEIGYDKNRYVLWDNKINARRALVYGKLCIKLLFDSGSFKGTF